MPSFTTVFRASIMFVAAVLVVKGWQQYGPTTEQVKSVATRALDLAHDALNQPQQPSMETPSLTATPQPNLPVTTLQSPSHASSGPMDAAPPFAAPPIVSAGDIAAAPPVFSQPPASVAEPPVDSLDRTPALSAADSDRMPELMSRLEELGGVEPQLVLWGNSGRLYRFCCRAAMGNAPSFSRHFESVAAQPLIAVEEVLAKVEAWRTAERARSPLQ